jgi:hypothetical protein
MHCATKNVYYHMLELMWPHVKAMLDDMCALAKDLMDAMDPSELGSFSSAVMCGDGVWLTRDFHSQNVHCKKRTKQSPFGLQAHEPERER